MTLPSLADLDQTFGCQVCRLSTASEHDLNGVCTVKCKHQGNSSSAFAEAVLPCD